MSEMNDFSSVLTAEENKPVSNVQDACEKLSQAMESSKQALNEFLHLKEDVLMKCLSGETLTKVDLITSKLSQSFSEIENPVSEIVHFVRLSSSKDDKTTALHKLQTSYDKKCRQLDIALRKLAKISSQAEKLSKERRIQNWEKLFLTTLENKNRIRQWRFRIPQVLANAQKGQIHFSAFIEKLIEENEVIKRK